MFYCRDYFQPREAKNKQTDEVAVRTTTQAAAGMIHLVTTAAILLAVTHLATTLAAR
jgi:hypothetical protein